MPQIPRGRRPSLVFTYTLLFAAGAAGIIALQRRLPNIQTEIALLLGWLFICSLIARGHRHMRQRLEEAARAEAAAAQATRLAQLTAALSNARTHVAAVEAALQEPLHAFGADAGMVILIDRHGTPITIPRAVGYSDEERAARESRIMTAKTPVSVAVGRGAPVIVPTAAAYAKEYGDGAAEPFEMTIAVPLQVGSRVIAVVQLEFRGTRRLSDDDREYLDVLAPRAAQALDRTFEFEAAVHARAEAEALRERADQELAERQKMEGALRSSEMQYRTLAARTSRLHVMAAALSKAATLYAVARAVVEHGCNVTGAAAGEVMLLLEERFETLYASGPATAPETVAMDPSLCATEAVTTLAPVFVASFAEWQERYARSAALAADGGYVSSATLPLVADGAPIGVVAFHFTAPVNFDETYRGLLVSVAQQCAQACHRARSYEAAQAARAEAEAANRTKDEFVSIISHELRTPLNAILGWASMLQQNTIDPGMRERALQSVADNAKRQLDLVQDLLDFSRLQAKRITLDLEDVDLRSLLRGVVETILPTAASKGLRIDVAPVPSVHVFGDARRIEQVFFNLLGNAVKFTPAGGEVRVAVRQVDGAAEISVRDTGDGIDPAFLPFIFDAFRQADPRSGRHGGVGLGLSIARELVQAHKGTIRAESGPGQGTTFVVTLPLHTAAAVATVH
jgi:signal transduction histidine kinase